MQRFGFGRRAFDNSARGLIVTTGLMLAAFVTDGVSQSPDTAAPSRSNQVPQPNEPPSKESVLGRRLADCFFTDATGRQVALSDYRDKHFLVIVFMGTECPVGNMYGSSR